MAGADRRDSHVWRARAASRQQWWPAGRPFVVAPQLVDPTCGAAAHSTAAVQRGSKLSNDKIAESRWLHSFEIDA